MSRRPMQQQADQERQAQQVWQVRELQVQLQLVWQRIAQRPDRCARQ